MNRKHLGCVHTELLAIVLAMPKKWKLNIINGTVHTGISKILSNSYACGKDKIFAKDFAKKRVGYAIFLVSIAISKESLFGIAIAKLSVDGPLWGRSGNFMILNTLHEVHLIRTGR